MNTSELKTKDPLITFEQFFLWSLLISGDEEGGQDE
jgi:hypothetical protein